MTEKELIEPTTALYPVPVVLVSCTGSGNSDNTDNIIAISWIGTVCSDPPMLSISVRPERFSHGLIRESGEFVVNIPTREQLPAVKLCGTKSGVDVDKWSEAGLTRESSSHLARKTPLIRECPVNI
ncbi:MAG: flavin reductase family protein, partial [Candidatus Hodarchaeales archaeon]